MTPSPAESSAPTSRLGPTRRRVLALLQQSAAPIGVDDIAQALDIHANTARFHVDALAEEGLVSKVSEPRTTQGRPRTLYGADPAVPSVAGDHYRDLAMALTHYLATTSPDPAGAALAAGETWGRHLAETEVPAQDGDLAGLVDTVNGLGFSSRLVEDEDRPILEITRCPYRDAALTDEGMICTLHLGVLRGYLDGRGSPHTAASLEHWVQENLCVARFADRAAPDD